MKRFVCSVCGYVYDEALGAPQAGTPAGTRWDALAENWVCPLCGAARTAFYPEGAGKTPQPIVPVAAARQSDLKPLPAVEMSAVCSNLARGCEKQNLPEEAGWYRQLEAYFKSLAGTLPDASAEQLYALALADLDTGIAQAATVAREEGDRGAQRALVWDEKVTRIQRSLLERVQREGESMLNGVHVYVCTVCGFIYLGAEPPALCPVCKVPAWKFEQVEGRVQA
ncbi:MAG: rubredoxin [Candidatus Limiplasma sp.]|nr:rubredoxin [Candidatus Limiplasma sp.]